MYLSTIGAQAGEPNLLTQHTIIEQVLGELSMPIVFLRPGGEEKAFACGGQDYRYGGLSGKR